MVPSSYIPVPVGAPLTYTATVTNTGPDTATGVTLVAAVPAAVTFGSAPTGCTRVGSTLTCALGALLNAASTTVTLTVTPVAVGQLPFSVAVSGAPADPQPANNSATTSVTVLPPPDTVAPVSTLTATPGVVPQGLPLLTATGTATFRSTAGTVLGTAPV